MSKMQPPSCTSPSIAQVPSEKAQHPAVPSKKVQPSLAPSEKTRPALTFSEKEKQSTSPRGKVEVSEKLSEKTKDGETSANVGGGEVPLEPAAKRLKFSKWRLRAVLADAATERLPMVEVLTVEVEDPRQTSALVRCGTC